MKSTKIAVITKVFFGVAVICTLFSMGARADFAKRLSYQGRLTDSNGVPLSNGTYDMTFKIFDASTAGSQLWSEAHTGASQVTVTNGLFSVVLGDITTLNGVSFDGTEYWIEVAVGATTYSPRQRLTASAMSLNIPDSIVSSTKIVDSAVTNTKIADNSVSTAKIQNLAVTNGKIANSSVSAAKIVDGACLSEILDDDGTGSGLDCDTLDGLDWSNLTGTGSDYWVNVSGDTMSGILNMGNNGISNIDWSASDDGSGSSLDADLLDGLHETSFFQLGQNETVTGTPAFNGGTTGSTPPFSVDSTFVVTSLNADLHDGYHAGNASGNIPVSNGTLNTNLNADLHDGYHAGNASGNIPVSNGTLNTNLNADLLDGHDTSYFMTSTTDNWVNISGDTMTGELLTPAIRVPTTAYSSGVAVDFGDTTVDYPANAGWAATYNATVLLSGLDSTSIAFHDAGQDVGVLRYRDNNFYMGETGPWGVSNLTVGGDVVVSGSDVYLTDGNTRLTEGSGNAVRVQTNSGYVDIGPQNTGWSHFSTDRASFYFNTKVTADGNVEPYTNNTRTLGSSSLRWNNAYLTTLDVTSTGLVSNLNADYLDGQHGSYYMAAATDNWVNTTGDTMSGALYMNFNGSSSYGGGNIHLKPASAGSLTSITFDSNVNSPSDYGYVTYYDDNNSYNWWGDSGENSALVIGTENDGRNGSSDVVVLKSPAAVIVDSDNFYPRRITPKYSSWAGDGDGGSAIINDNGGYKALMIVGSDQGQGYGRWIRMWDYLTVQGSANVTGTIYQNGVSLTCDFVKVTANTGATVYCPVGKAVLAGTDTSNYLVNPGNFASGPNSGFMICCPAATPFPTY